jgi:hypothetical protein
VPRGFGKRRKWRRGAAVPGKKNEGQLEKKILTSGSRSLAKKKREGKGEGRWARDGLLDWLPLLGCNLPGSAQGGLLLLFFVLSFLIF